MSSTPTVRKFWSLMQYWTDSSWRSFLGECCSRSSMNWCFVMLVERLCLLKGDLFHRGAYVCLFRYCHWILVGVTGVSQCGIFQVPAQRLCKLLMTLIKAQMVQSSLTSLLPGTGDFPAFWVLIQVIARLFYFSFVLHRVFDRKGVEGVMCALGSWTRFVSLLVNRLKQAGMQNTVAVWLNLCHILNCVCSCE